MNLTNCCISYIHTDDQYFPLLLDSICLNKDLESLSILKMKTMDAHCDNVNFNVVRQLTKLKGLKLADIYSINSWQNITQSVVNYCH